MTQTSTIRFKNFERVDFFNIILVLQDAKYGTGIPKHDQYT